MQLLLCTVVDANDCLLANRTILLRAGSGYCVASRPAPVAISSLAPILDGAVKPFWGHEAVPGRSGYDDETRLLLAASHAAGTAGGGSQPQYRPFGLGNASRQLAL